MPRPYWSGQIQISLVSFGVKLFPATEAKSEIRFHQLSRKTGERIKHQKVSGGDGPVETSDIVKGYEYRKGEYVTVEPEEIEHLRIPSRHTLEVTQFVDEEELDPEFFEKPYFVVPENDVQAEAFAVVRKALQVTKKVALGKIAFGGREHLVAVSAPADDKLTGMMAYTIRYAEELRDPAEYFEEIRKVPVDADQLSLAKELIKRKAAKFVPEKFKDEYEARAYSAG
jgi:DNA end-binding protein Ku